ncbi:hypothetical protein BDB00DRAFT_805189 [Zychaea mexicana]|uniref:uncharacterized protein n=1 Tax=Zychaea mexicana TaxID=64656 RepID=UPI0022FF1FDB|nr:uncharacterized protein BDB00DRAFT_805189 [Zychaea mexicana]KAI9497152.1 hypothetical protein BDB00DRAFT_805189 [Zychaea mexicana]
MSVLKKLFLIGTLALSAANAQEATSAAPSEPAASSSVSAAAAAPTPSGGASGFQFKESYPTDGSVPVPKQEWMALLQNANITDAPVVKANGNAGPQQSGTADPYCDWTFTGCTRETDIVACPKGQWGITYDDGPTQFSPKLYDFLDQTQQKATLFLIGGQVIKYADLTERAFKAGHELAIHTWSHSYLTTLTTEQVVAELKWTETAIKEVTGFSPRFFRPPYGDIDDRVRGIAAALGFTPVIWNHDTDDWMAGEQPGFNEQWIDGNVTEWAAANATATEGGISLEHDLYQKTVDAAIRVLPVLQKSYKVTTVGACTGQQAYKEGAAPNNATTSATPSSSASSSGVAPDGSSAAEDSTQEGAASQVVVARTVIGAAALAGAVSYFLA